MKLINKLAIYVLALTLSLALTYGIIIDIERVSNNLSCNIEPIDSPVFDTIATIVLIGILAIMIVFFSVDKKQKKKAKE